MYIVKYAKPKLFIFPLIYQNLYVRTSTHIFLRAVAIGVLALNICMLDFVSN